MDSTCPTLLMLLSNRRLLLCLPSWCPWGGLHRADRDPLQNDYTARKSGLCGGRLKTQAGKGHILSAGGEIWCIQNVNDCFIFPRVFLFLGRRKAWQHWKPITALKSNNYGLITEMEHFPVLFPANCHNNSSSNNPPKWHRSAQRHDNMQVDHLELEKHHFSPEDLICIQMHVNPASLEEAGEKPL